jgi:hypothetical protein
MCHRHYSRWQQGKRGEDLAAPVRNYGIGEVDLLDRSGPPSPKIVYDTEWKSFCDWIGLREQRKSPVSHKLKEKTITEAVFTDIHAPFHCMESIIRAVQWAVDRGAKRAWLGGDIADHYSLSRFNQYEAVGIQQEAVEVRKILDLFSRSFNEVRIIGGNHESRERKYLSARLPADLLNWFLSKSFMERLTEDMDNVYMEKISVEGSTLHWITPIGKDAILAHAESVSKISLRAAENVRQWMDNWHDVIDVARPRLVMQAHTHQAGMAPVGKRIILETGCLCKVQSYALEPRLYGKPQTQAATVFTQVDGVTDLNSIRQLFLNL